jgi:hypothetical protein
MVAGERQPVLFIAGTGRSGSTLLDRLLGQASEVFSAGEIRYLWQNSLIDDHLCGCGQPFSRCALWSSIMRDVFGRFGEPTSPDEIIGLKASVDRMRFVPSLALDVMGDHRRLVLERYRRLLELVFRSIRERTGSRLIVDSTKDPSHGFVLATSPEVELHVVHLVRDSRAVAHSWTRRKRDPARREPSAMMPIESPARSARIWSVHNGLSSMLRPKAASYVRIRYEDFTADPRAVVGDLLGPLGIPAPDRSMRGGEVELELQHTISGNPMRFDRGPIVVKRDDDWLSTMRRRDKLAVSLSTWPQLLAYGYPLRPRPSRTVPVSGAQQRA